MKEGMSGMEGGVEGGGMEGGVEGGWMKRHM